MVEAGHAKICVGNHELNAIGYITPHPMKKGEYLRPHIPSKVEQHKAFIDAYGFGTPDHLEVVSWFKTIPLWLDLGEIRVIHACWHQDKINELSPYLTENHSMGDHNKN